jgi:hypothetical protein
MEPKKSYKDISDEEAIEFLDSCKIKYHWSSDPGEPCNQCEFRQFCKGSFYQKDPAVFDYDLEELKRTIFRKYLAENVFGDTPTPEEQQRDEMSYI